VQLEPQGSRTEKEIEQGKKEKENEFEEEIKQTAIL